MNKDFLTFGSPHIGKEEINEVVDCLKSGWLGTGPRVAKFEKSFNKYKKSNYSIAVNSCSAALHLSMLALSLNKGDEVITTPLTFCSTINAIIHSNLKPVLADIDPKTMNIDPNEIEKKITKKTKCILLVHFAGLPCEMDEIMKIAKKYKLYVVEDCAHSIESTYNGQPTGTFGDFGCFSFYSTKNLVTGEGGMVTVRQKKYAEKIKMLALHGLSKDAWKRFRDKGYNHYYVQEAGFKYNMMDIQASIGLHQLNKIDRNWKKRKIIWKKYNSEFKKLPIVIPPKIKKNVKHAFHLYTILVNKKNSGRSRSEFLQLMQKQNIGVGVHYQSIPEHKYYQKNYHWRAKFFS